MTIRAKSDPRFYLRFLLIGVAIFAMALWFLYDATIGYPKQHEQAVKYHELKEANKLETWPDVAREQGWPTDIPKNEFDIQGQYIWASVAALLGLWALSVVWLARGRWIEGTKTGITSSWGQSLDFANVITLDKKLWRKKGIAKITYQDGNRRRRFVLDDYKFQREPTGKILCELEARLDPEKIINGLPEGAEEEQGEDGGPDATG
jgi:hypothetical protein